MELAQSGESKLGSTEVRATLVLLTPEVGGNQCDINRGLEKTEKISEWFGGNALLFDHPIKNRQEIRDETL